MSGNYSILRVVSLAVGLFATRAMARNADKSVTCAQSRVKGIHQLAAAALAAVALSASCSASATGKSEQAVLEILRAAMGTTYVIPHTDSVDGVINACGLEFAALQRDASSATESYVKLVGSFYLRFEQVSGLGYSLKLGIFDPLAGPNNIATRPANAFVRPPNGKAPKKPVRVDGDAGFALYMGLLDEDVIGIYRSIVDTKRIEVGFNRQAGRRDTTALLDLTVVQTDVAGGKFVRKHSSAAVDQFAMCSNQLVNRAEAEFK